jgi:5'-3' exoribonuclease 2
MTDEESSIIDFYPENFAIDLNGKKWAWQGVALLPFIEEARLLEAMNEVYPELSEDDRTLNITGSDYLFVGQNHAIFEYFCDAYGKIKAKTVGSPLLIQSMGYLLYI